MPQVFISYRRADSAPDAGRLTDSLRHLLGRGAVFRDVGSIPPGDNFDTALDEALKCARAVIVLIGPDWLAELSRRQSLPERDFVRLEVSRALQGARRVIPVLLRGAQLPPQDALPQDLQAIRRKEAITLHDEQWDAGVESLAQAIGKPYKWGALALRAAGLTVALLVAALGLLRSLNVLQARNLILVAIAAYAVAEVIAAMRGKGR
jgi:hypothetical protein